MQRILFLLSFVALSLGGLAPVAEAQTMPERQLSSFEVTTLAYQGKLDSEGIPGYGVLAANIQSGSITAEAIIRAAIEAGRLSEAAIEDDGFVLSVERQLDALIESN